MTSENMANPGGPMTECTAAPTGSFSSCKFFQALNKNENKCRYCAFDEYCICIEAYLDKND